MGVKDLLSEVNLNELETNIKRNVSMTKLADNMINNRKKELGEIEGNGLVSKMLQQKKAVVVSKTPVTKPLDITDSYAINIDEVNAELNK